METLSLPLRTCDLYKVMNRCNLLVGSPRANIRVNFDVDVELCLNNQISLVRATTLSSEGIFISGLTDLEIGSKLQIKLPTEHGKHVTLESQVFYPVKSNNPASSGTVLKFCNMSIENRKMLQRMISTLLLGDVLNDQELIFFES